MTIRSARPDEAAALTAIAFAAKRHWGYPEAWIVAWRGTLTLTPAVLAAQTVRVAELGGEAVGFHGVILGGNVAVLDHLWVRPAAMGRGVGRALFADAESIARAGGALLLRTTADPHAAGFYAKQGMRVTGREAAPVAGTPRELPVMEKALALRRRP